MVKAQALVSSPSSTPQNIGLIWFAQPPTEFTVSLA
jgi:hypothetical protein